MKEMNTRVRLSTFVLEDRKRLLSVVRESKPSFLTDRPLPGLAHSHGGVQFCYLSSWHVVPVRNDCSEGNGRSEDKKGENKCDKDFHSEISLFGLWA